MHLLFIPSTPRLEFHFMDTAEGDRGICARRATVRSLCAGSGLRYVHTRRPVHKRNEAGNGDLSKRCGHVKKKARAKGTTFYVRKRREE